MRTRLECHSRLIRQTLERIRTAIDASPKAWSDITNLTAKEYQKVRLAQDELPITNLMRVACNLDLNVEMLLNGNIDYDALSEHFAGNAAYIPEKYSVGAFSRRRTIINILDCLTTSLGPEIRYRVLKRFQIKPRILSEPNGYVNIRLVADALEVAAQALPEKGLTFMLGAHSVASFKDSPIGLTLRKLHSVSSVYEYIVYELNSLYDENHQYTIASMTEDGCVVRSKPSEKLIDALKTRFPGSVSVCQYRAGVAASAPTYIGMPMASVQKTHCIHWNDPYCSFKIGFPTDKLAWNQLEPDPLMRPSCTDRVLH